MNKTLLHLAIAVPLAMIILALAFIFAFEPLSATTLAMGILGGLAVSIPIGLLVGRQIKAEGPDA